MINSVQLKHLRRGQSLYDINLNRYRFIELYKDTRSGSMYIQVQSETSKEYINIKTHYFRVSGLFLSRLEVTKLQKMHKLNRDYVDPRLTEAENLIDEYKHKHKSDDDKLRELVTEIELDAFDSTFDNVLSNTDRRRR